MISTAMLNLLRQTCANATEKVVVNVALNDAKGTHLLRQSSFKMYKKAFIARNLHSN